MTDPSADPPTPAPEPPAEPLVLAMPRRELFTISGFVARIDLGILESLAEESWFALPASLAGNFDAKEVRLGLVVMHGDEVLLGDGGSLLHSTPIHAEVGRLGRGIKALRDLAQLSGAAFLGVDACRVELAGYLNDDSLEELRDFFMLIYRCRAPDGCVAPAGMSWAPSRGLAGHALDPVSTLLAASLFPAA